MNEMLNISFPHICVLSVTQIELLGTNSPADLQTLANNKFKGYILQNTLASAGSNYHKNDIGISIYNGTFLKLQFPKFLRRFKLDFYISEYLHSNIDFKITDMNDNMITFTGGIYSNSYNPDWNWVGGNKSGIYINGNYHTKYCGWEKTEDLINKTGHFTLDWNVENFPDCYDDSMPCILSFVHSGARNGLTWFKNLEIYY